MMMKKIYLASISVLLMFLLISASTLANVSYYTVKNGDSLFKIAKIYSTTVQSIMIANGLKNDMIYPGQRLVISTSGGIADPNPQVINYTVKSGDTLWIIAQKFGISIESIRNINSLYSNYIYPGQVLKIPAARAPKGGNEGVFQYTVQSGDTLWLIAQRFGTTVAKIKEANGLSSDILMIGQVMLIPATGGSGSQGTYITYLYQVKWEDSLWGIAAKFGISAQSIASANMLKNNDVKSWMALIIPNPSMNIDQLERFSIPNSISLTDFHKLVRITYAESGSEPYNGQVAVAAVVLNRIKSPLFPNTLDAVLNQPWQFEAVLNGYYYQAVPTAVAYKATLEAINGHDPTKGALFFFNPDLITNQWLLSKPVTYRIGTHVFAK